MSRKIIGIDVRQDSISAVLIKSGIKGIWVEGHLHIPISEQTTTPGEKDGGEEEITINPAMMAAMEEITEKLDTGGSVAVAAFPAAQVSFRNIRIPFKDQKKIRKILPFELEPALPFPTDEMIIDFHTISDMIKSPDTKGETEIIAVAADIPALKSYIDVFASFDLTPDIITTGGYAAALCLAKFANIPEHCLFMDIDSTACTLFAIVSGQICLIRAFPISPNAGKAESLCADIERTLLAFKENTPFGFHPDEIHITGYGSNVPGLEQGIERILDIPVRRADLIRTAGAKVKAEPSTVMKTSAQLDNAFALGLADTEGIIDLNLRQGPFAPQKQWQENKKSFIHTGILLLMVLASAFFIMTTELYSVEKQVNVLTAQINGIFKEAFPDKPIVEPVAQMQAALEELKKDLPRETGSSIRMKDVFNEFSRRVPKDIDVEFTRLIMGPEKIQISANTDTFNSVDEIKNKLEEADIFQEVIISNSKSDKTGNRVSFKLNIKMRDA